jgi:hypothetical protein
MKVTNLNIMLSQNAERLYDGVLRWFEHPDHPVHVFSENSVRNKLVDSGWRWC